MRIKPTSLLATMLITSAVFFTSCREGETDKDVARFEDESFKKHDKNSGATNSSNNGTVESSDTLPVETPRVVPDEPDTSRKSKR